MNKLIKGVVSKTGWSALAILVLAACAWGGQQMGYWMTGFSPDTPNTVTTNRPTSDDAFTVAKNPPPLQQSSEEIQTTIGQSIPVSSKPPVFGPANSNAVALPSFAGSTSVGMKRVSSVPLPPAVMRPADKRLMIGSPVPSPIGFQQSGGFSPPSSKRNLSDNSASKNPPSRFQSNGFSANSFGPPAVGTRNHSKQLELNSGPQWVIRTRETEVLLTNFAEPIEWKIETKFGVIKVRSDDLLSMVVQKKVDSPEKAKSTTTSSPASEPIRENDFPVFDTPDRPMPDDDAPFESATRKIERNSFSTAASGLKELQTFVRQLDEASGSDPSVNGSQVNFEPIQELSTDEELKQEKSTEPSDAEENKDNRTEPADESGTSGELETDQNSKTVKRNAYSVLVATTSGELFQGVCELEPIAIKFAWGTATIQPESLGWLNNRRYGTYQIQRGHGNALMLREVSVQKTVQLVR